MRVADRRWSRAIGLLVLLASVPACAPRRGSHQGVLRLDPTSIDVGRVRQGDPVTVRFALVNEGDAPIEIGSIRPSCTCISELSVPPYVAPNAAASCSGTVDTFAMSGVLKASLTVESADGAAIKLSITGEILAPIRALSPTVDFGERLVGEPGTAVVVLRSVVSRPFRILGIRALDHTLDAIAIDPPSGEQVASGVAAGDAAIEQRVRLRLPSASAPGMVQGRIVLLTDDTELPEVKLHAISSARARIVAPRLLEFGAPLPDATREASLVIRRPPSTRPLHVELVGQRARVGGGVGVSIAGVEHAREGGEVRVRFRIAEPAEARFLAGDAVLKTDDPLLPTLDVAYQCFGTLPSATPFANGDSR